MVPITFITGNDGKWRTAQAVLNTYGVALARQQIEIPEIQSLSVEDVAAFSAEYASAHINQPAVVTDVGYYFSALKGFPGPFIKFINQTLTSADLLDLMAAHDDRSVVIRECLAYAVPGEQARVFMSEQRATLTHEAVGHGSSIDNILVLEGFATTVGATSRHEIELYWAEKLSHYHAFGLYLQSL